jgi:acyl-homoserine lactone acylase PvdQ
VAEWTWRILDAPPPDDPVLVEAVRVLRTWDLGTDAENPAAAIGVLTVEPLLEALDEGRELPDLFVSFAAAAHALHEAYGRIDVPWGEVNRMRRGGVDLGLGGGPDVLRAVKSEGGLVEGRRLATGGDSLVLLVEWDHNGKLRSRSIQPYGSATSRPDSPHYADQAPYFAAQQMKEVWMDEAEIRANLEREYRPGEEGH